MPVHFEAGASNPRADRASKRRTSDTAWRHTIVCVNRLKVHNLGERKELVSQGASGARSWNKRLCVRLWAD